MLYQVNNKNIENKEREKLEFAIKYNKQKNNNIKNTFYLATNSQGIDLLLNKILKNNNSNILDSINLDHRTWLKVWGDINLDEHKNSHKIIDNLQFAIQAPEINFSRKANDRDIKIRNLSGNFAYKNKSFKSTLDDFTVYFQRY